MVHQEEVQRAFNRACHILKMRGFVFQPMNRTAPVKSLKKSFLLGHTSLHSKTVTIDIFTPRKRLPKKISAILAVVAHELAHHQKPPYRQRYRGRMITRAHHPVFYRQVNRNIAQFKKDQELRKYYAA